MPNIDLSVNTGQTKQLTFNCANTYMPEDIVFNITAAGGDANTTLSGIAYCSTAASTAAKTATMPGFALSSGQRIILYLATASTVASATLNVNSTGAKTIKIGSANTTTSNFTAGYWVCEYDGTNWNASRLFADVKQDDTTTSSYRKVILSGNTYSSAGTAVSATTGQTYATQYVEVQPSTGKIRSKGFVKASPTNTTGILLADGSDIAQSTFATSGHTHNYLPLSGGQMTGPLTWANSTALPEQTNPQYVLTIDAFTNGGTTKWTSIANLTNAHDHTVNMATSSATNQLTLGYGTKYSIAVGGSKFVFTTPSLGTTATTAATGNHTHTTSIATSTGTNQITLGYGSKYSLTSGGTSYVFTTPSLGTTATTAAAGNHTHATSIATSTGTSQITLAHGSKYSITAGGTSYIFTMPSDSNTDTLVKQTVDATTTEYPILLSAQSAPTSGTAYESKYSNGLKATGGGDIVFQKSSDKCILQFDNTLKCLNFIFE